MMALSGHSLGKYVCKLKISGNMQRSDDSSIHDFLNRMIVHFNMLRMLLKNKIGCNPNDTRVVSMKRSGVELREAKLS
jgi:hypothetical protein